MKTEIDNIKLAKAVEKNKKLSITSGKNLKKLREDKGLSHIDVADETGFTKSYISVLESGRREPSVTAVKKLAKLYGVSIDFVIGHTKDKTRYHDADCDRNFYNFRKNNSISQYNMAHIMQYHQMSNLSNFERGITDKVPLKRIAVLSDYFDVPADFFLDETDEMVIKARMP